MENLQILQSIQREISEIKKALLSTSGANSISNKWVPRSEVMSYFNYAPTQMAALEKSGDIIVTKVGKRKFILRESITKLLDRHILPAPPIVSANSTGNEQ